MKKQGLRKNKTNKISHLYGLMFKELRCLNVHCEKKAFPTVPLHRASWFLSGGKKKGNSNLPTPSSVPRAALIPCKQLDGSWLVNRAKESQ